MILFIVTPTHYKYVIVTSFMILLIVTIKDITCMQSHDIINDTINSNNYYLTF